MTRSKVVVTVVCIVLGAFIGGLISTQESDKKQKAIAMMSQVAENTGSMKFRAGAEIGRQEMQSDRIVGYGIGGIVGGVVGLIFITVTRKAS
ncbi:hypothetical protein NST58_01000 [Paenibacillus sp. FSL R10-2796]|uniref:hypothetical protein n=1 Tax=Paenibacillus sp. FSL R10-2796 TaxID=2954663 RepID=UPI0030D961AA